MVLDEFVEFIGIMGCGRGSACLFAAFRCVSTVLVVFLSAFRLLDDCCCGRRLSIDSQSIDRFVTREIFPKCCKALGLNHGALEMIHRDEKKKAALTLPPETPSGKTKTQTW